MSSPINDQPAARRGGDRHSRLTPWQRSRSGAGGPPIRSLVTSRCNPSTGCGGGQRDKGRVVEGSVRRFLPALPKSFYRHPAGGRRAHGCGPLSAAPTARPFRSWAAGSWARKALAVPPRRAAGQPVCPGYQRTTVASAQAKPGVRHRARGCAGTLVSVTLEN